MRRRLQREGKSGLPEVAQLAVLQPTVAQWAAAVEPAPLVVALPAPRPWPSEAALPSPRPRRSW